MSVDCQKEVVYRSKAGCVYVKRRLCICQKEVAVYMSKGGCVYVKRRLLYMPKRDCVYVKRRLCIFVKPEAEAYSETCQTPKMNPFAKTVNS